MKYRRKESIALAKVKGTYIDTSRLIYKNIQSIIFCLLRFMLLLTTCVRYLSLTELLFFLFIFDRFNVRHLVQLLSVHINYIGYHFLRTWLPNDFSFNHFECSFFIIAIFFHYCFFKISFTEKNKTNITQ